MSTLRPLCSLCAQPNRETADCPRCAGGGATPDGERRWLNGDATMHHGQARAPGFFAGVSVLFAALGFLWRHPKLWPYVIVPIAVNTVVLAGAVYGLWYYSDALLADWLATDNVLLAWVYPVIRWTVLVLMAVVAVFVFSFTAKLIAAPFNDLLSEQVERTVLGRKFEERASLSAWVRPIFDALALLCYQLWRMLLYLPVLLIPVVGGILYTLLLCYLSATDLLDLPLARRRLTFAEKRSLWIWNRRAVLGLGTGFYFAVLIPVVNLLVIPIAVIGGTLLLFRLRKSS